MTEKQQLDKFLTMKHTDKKQMKDDDNRTNDYSDFYVPYVPLSDMSTDTPSCDVVVCDCPCDCGV